MVAPSRKPGSPIVLVVDDEPLVRLLCERILRHAGYLVLSAEGGLEALDLLSRLQPCLDLLLTDIRMPGLSGDVLAAGLRQQNPTLAILLMSGHRQGGEELPAPLLLKPFTADQLVAAVKAAIADGVDHATR